MSTTFAEIKGPLCADCGEQYADVHVDYMDSQGCAGLTLKAVTQQVDLSPQMIADLVDILVAYQNDEKAP